MLKPEFGWEIAVIVATCSPIPDGAANPVSVAASTWLLGTRSARVKLHCVTVASLTSAVKRVPLNRALTEISPSPQHEKVYTMGTMPET
jgi:hypothetical protein